MARREGAAPLEWAAMNALGRPPSLLIFVAASLPPPFDPN